jgi:uncharacterized RDD family membrane protein YckC
MKYAGFWKRFAASLIDSVILIPIGYLAALIGSNDNDSLKVLIVSTIFTWLYFSIFESQGWQGTPGKHFMKIIVTDYSGNKISFARATARYFAKYLSTLILLFGYIMVAFTKRKQALHDLIAETLVLNSNESDKFINYSDEVIDNKTQVINLNEINKNNLEKIVMAGFDSKGNVLRLSFLLDDPKINNQGLILGRDSLSCDLYISDTSISRRHARIFKKNHEIYIEDLGSTNGMIVDGKKINSGQSAKISLTGTLSIGGIELTLGRG